ncbi:MAG: aldo/keto reductase [Spirochaetes bacterium DG_61]|nr:MAG: aldo/keto reductase [Spirochaetes bacterium DG_61]
MEFRELGESGLKVSVITFGAWAIGGWMWGGQDRKEALAGIQRALDLGVTSIDTAPAYGFGLSEEIVGEAIRGKRDRVQILTKFGLRWDTDKGVFYFDSQDNDGKPVNIHKYAGKESVIRECEQSLKRLDTDYIDLYQIHWADSTTPIEETMEACSLLVQQGKVRAVGVCNYSVDQMKTAEKVLKLASNQIPYSMINRGMEDEVIPYCMKMNRGVLAYSPLQRGLLTGKIKPGHSFGPGDHRPSSSFFTEGNINRVLDFLEALRPIAGDKNATLAQLVIRWTIQRPGITVALVGVRNPKQAEENAKAFNVKLSEEEVQKIDTLLAALKLDL